MYKDMYMQHCNSQSDVGALFRDNKDVDLGQRDIRSSISFTRQLQMFLPFPSIIYPVQKVFVK